MEIQVGIDGSVGIQQTTTLRNRFWFILKHYYTRCLLKTNMSILLLDSEFQKW